MALEPAGPPYKDAVFDTGSDRGSGPDQLASTSGSPLEFEQQAEPDGPGLVACWSQTGEIRRVKNVAGIPVLLITTEASYYAGFDHCTARYLHQAGVNVEFVRLQDKGMHGNGHMMMLEMNNIEIAEFLDAWLTSKIG